MPDTLEGGCFCGEVKYKITGEAVLQLMCFCRDCLSTTGTDGYAGLMVRSEDFQLIQGHPARHERTSRKGRTVTRHFCGTCGSNLYGVTSFGLTSVAAGSLDEPDRFQPTKKVFTQDAPVWARLPEELEEM
ncbi:MAG: GFA family protein [Pseudomonadota bacterium]